jgi:hypothetical protein
MRIGTGKPEKNMSHQENRGGRVRTNVGLTGSRGASNRGRGRVRVLFATLAASAMALFALAGSASAHQLFQYEFEKTFKGADSTAEAFTSGITGIAINQAGHRIYVLDSHGSGFGGHGWISQFNLSGEAVNFSGLAGVSSFEAGEGGNYPDLVFDNTGHEGGMYSNVGYSGVTGWKPDGTKWIEFTPGGGTTGLGVDEDGTLYVSNVNGANKWDPFTNTQIQAPFPGYMYEQQEQHITVDTNRYVYTGKDWNEERREGTFKYYKGEENIGICCDQGFVDASSIRFSYVPTPYTTVDRSDNNIFSVEGKHIEGTEEGEGFGRGVKVTEYSDLGQPITTFGLPEGSFGGLEKAKAVAVDSETHKVYVTTVNGTAGEVAVFKRKAPVTVPDVSTGKSGHPSKTSGILNGTVNADGVKTTGCKFEWGTTTKYTKAPVTCAPGTEFEGTTDHAVNAEITGLTPGTIYHFRLASKNANEQWSYSPDHTFEASLPPTVSPIVVDQVNTDGARFGSLINPEGGTTQYHFELGEEDCSSNPCTQLPATPVTLESRLSSEQVFQTTTGLQPDTPYYIRVIAENEAGENSFTLLWRTYPSPPGKDPCPNAHVRQQTSAALLPDCRAYELVSAANAGGYEVESTLVPGQTPYPGYPNAQGRVLYGLHYGSLPGVAGEPPNFGLDPYVAERGENGWVSRYVGLPGGGMADPNPYGSPLLGADDHLRDFAFGGEDICNPCFNGLGTNLPLRLNGGPPQPGMVGSEEPGESAPQGLVAKYLSADGSHLVFGSEQEFEEDGEGETLRIYERDLEGGGTQIVSTDEAGNTLGGNVAELDLSSDGSHVLIGDEVSEEAGDTYWQLYMHVGNAEHTTLLTQGMPSGAIFDGMTSDGSKVFFTTPDNLSGDSDESADIFEVEVEPNGTASAPRLISVNGNGTPSNADGCSPPGDWNAASGEGKCNAVAFADGAGLASGDGTFYFVSPEQLDGEEGTEDAANLYVVRPEPTAHPQFVATLDSSAPIDNQAVVHGVNEADTRRTSDFQVAPDGRYAVFTSLESLTGFLNLAHYEIYRYDTQEEELECASCATTGSAATHDTLLAPAGLNLSNDGRVFFTSEEGLVLSDTNGVNDAYEWSGGLQIGRLSTGSGVNASELLSATADGKDAFFFARNVLVPSDENGSAIKIYDAREGGGFPFNPEPLPCAASDECHGAGTQAPPPPNINSNPPSGVESTGTTTGPKRCRKGFVRRHGKCVRKHHHRRHHRGHRRHGNGRKHG